MIDKNYPLDMFLKKYQVNSIDDFTEEQFIDFLCYCFPCCDSVFYRGTEKDKKETIRLGKKAFATNKQVCAVMIGDECPPEWYELKDRNYWLSLEELS